MRELILNNFWLKVFSLVLAALIWFVLQVNFQSAEGRYPQSPFRLQQTREFRCPVTVLVLPQDEQKYQVQPAEVVVKLHGEATAVGELDPEDIQAFVNLSLVRETQGALRVEVAYPREMSLRSVLPSHVFVKAAP